MMNKFSRCALRPARPTLGSLPLSTLGLASLSSPSASRRRRDLAPALDGANPPKLLNHSVGAAIPSLPAYMPFSRAILTSEPLAHAAPAEKPAEKPAARSAAMSAAMSALSFPRPLRAAMWVTPISLPRGTHEVAAFAVRARAP